MNNPDRTLVGRRSFWFMAAAFIPYLLVVWYVHPAGDDLTYAHKTRDQGWATAYVQEYTAWNGRYISNALVLASPFLKNLFWYRAVALVQILLVLLAFRELVRTSLFCPPVNNWLPSLFLTLLFLYGMPDLAEGVYWYTGAVTYQTGLVFALLHLSFFLRFRHRNGKFVAFLSLVSLFLATGFNEVLMALLLAFHAGVFLWELVRKKAGAWSFLFFLVAISGASLMYFSPGNAVRAAHFSRDHELIHTLLMSGAQTLRFATSWLSELPVLIGSLILFLNAGHLKMSLPPFLTGQKKLLWLFFGIPFLVIFICCALPYWSTGILGQHRTINTAYAFFLISWGWFMILWGRHWDSKAFPSWLFRWQWVMVMIAVLSMALTNNGQRVAEDLITGKARTFDEELTQRYELLEKCRDKDQEACSLPPLSVRPESLFILDIKEDPSHWVNRGYSLFFRTGTVQRSAPSEKSIQ